MSIFATKSIEQLKAEAARTGEHSLKRVLGPINLVTLGIGAIIGTGIFVLTGEAAAQHSGPAIVLSMVLAGFASALAGLCYSEFASTVPIAGSAYTYRYATLGAFIPENTGTFGEYGWSGILRGAGVIFFAYIGFDAVSVAAQEAKNPQKDMPVGILGSLVVCTILYILVSGVMVGLVPYAQMKGSPAPMVVAIRAAEAASGGSSVLRAMTMLVELGAIAGLSSVMVVMMMAQPRIFYSMANDGLLPPFAKKIHPKFRTPHITSMITGVVVAIAAGVTPIGALGELVSIGTLLAFVIVSLGIVFLRKNRPDLERPFKTPGVPFVPALSALVSFGLMAGLPQATWERLIILLGLSGGR